MANINGNIPNIKNSQAINQSEIQNAMQNMNSAAGKSMILGAELTSNISNTASSGNMTNSVQSLNSSTSIGSEELQNVKKEVQKSGKNNGLLY
jgi:predicted HAD superfamily phosphohydrolase YqeG